MAKNKPQKMISATVTLRDGYGVPESRSRLIMFEDTCPKCGGHGLKVKPNSYCSDGVHYTTDNIECPKGCQFTYAQLVNVKGLPRPTHFYEVFAERFSGEEGGQYIGYGIRVYAQDFRGRTLLESIRDISTDGKAVAELAAKCNKEKLNPVHVRDVVEDFLADCEG